MKKSIECWIYNINLKKFLLLKVKVGDLEFWQPVTGGVEGKESNIEATIREIKEETNIEAKEYFLFSLGNQVVPINEELTIDKELFISLVNIENVTISNEHENWSWCEPKDVVDSIYWKNNIESFAKAINFLKSSGINQI